MKINIVGSSINLIVEEDNNNILDMLNCLGPFVSKSDDGEKVDISIKLTSNPKFIGILKVPKTAKEVFCGRFIRHLEDRKGNIYTTNGNSLLVGNSGNSKILGFISQNENLFVIRQLILYFLTFFLRSKGFFSLHAASLINRREGKGLLFPGGDGCGKTTIARGLAEIGFKCLSQDNCYLRWLDSKVWIISPFKITEKSCLPVPESDNLKSKKNFLYNLYNIKPHIDKCVPESMVFPHITGSERSKVLPISADEALIELLESIPYLCESNKERILKHIELLKKLSQQVTSYRLLSGIDIKKSPFRLYDLLKESIGLHETKD